mmetsp:Transcript_8806/g.18621  ORF Transcript_8806/g.18621 Transcript_8806/m.18621 type:complete len:303 (-) Transcript_8806:1579-2487(-)
MTLISTKLKRINICEPKKKNAALEKLYDKSDILSRHHQRTDEKCSIKEFTNKRREMLMLNMSINTQQEEIDKLHADLEKREHCLQGKEARLNEDMKRFDSFLKELDQKKILASKLLDEQLRLKTDKEHVVKELSQRIHIVESAMRQQRDIIERGTMCKQLSMSLTPDEWFCGVSNKKRIRQRERRLARIEKRTDEYRQQQQEAKSKEKQTRKPLRRRRQSPKDSNETKIEQEKSPVPDFEDEPLTSSDEECPPYFESTDQLLGAITRMEEGNCSIDKKVQENQVTLRGLQTQTNLQIDELKK